MDMQSRPPKLMDRVKAVMRVKRYSPHTEKNTVTGYVTSFGIME